MTIGRDSAPPDSRSADDRISASDASVAIPLIAEDVSVARESVETGAVRVRKHVERRSERVDEPVFHERVEVERRPVNRVVDRAPGIRQEGETLVVPVLEEVLVVEKRLVVREELHIKRVRDRSRVQQEITLQAEHASVERIDERPGAGDSAVRGLRPHHLPEGATSMDRTLVGVFETREQAQNVEQALLRLGVPREQLHLREDDEDASSLGAADTTAMRETDDDRKPGFFERLFGGLDSDEDHASQYSDAVRHGHFVVVADRIPDERIEEATDVMARYGAVDVDERVIGWRGGAAAEGMQDEAGSLTQRAGNALSRGGDRIAEALTPDDTSAGEPAVRGTSGMGERGEMAGAAGPRGTSDTTRIPVVEEQLQVGKAQVRRGGVRVYTRLMERPVQEEVTLREETAHVQRRAVDRPASEAELGAAFQEGSIELTETAEVPVVSKTARVVEEVEIGKEVSERTEVVNDTVRRTEVEVEDLPASRPQPGPTGGVRPNR